MKIALPQSQSRAKSRVSPGIIERILHADFTDRISILIVKQPGFFGFRNPGGLRLPIETVLRGGESDCRNRRLQKMFQLIGAAEQAGSGFPKILRAWNEQHWRYPLLDEKFQPEQTVLRLPTTSLLPPEAVDQLDQRFGQKFRELGQIERLAVVTALVENKVTNQRMRTMTVSHANDLTAIFKSLVNNGFLVPDGFGRGTSYRLPGQNIDEQAIGSQRLSNDLFSIEATSESAQNSEQARKHTQHLEGTPQHLEAASQHLEAASQHLEGTPQHLETASQHLTSDRELDQRLVTIAAPIKATKNAHADSVRATILQLCQDRFLSLRTLADLLGRKPLTLQNHYINPMLKNKLLEYRYPEHISHPEQSYRTVKTDEEYLETA